MLKTIKPNADRPTAATSMTETGYPKMPDWRGGYVALEGRLGRVLRYRPAPTIFVGTDPEPDSLVFKWGKKLDVHDSMPTRVQIAYCPGDGCIPADSIYASGTESTIAEIEETWGTTGGGAMNIVKFKITADFPAGTYVRFRVILIDSRGSRTQGSDIATLLAPPEG